MDQPKTICKCICHQDNSATTHVISCCEFAYKKYISKDLVFDLKRYKALLNVKFKENPKIYATTRVGTVQAWRTIGDKKHFFRSKWEINFANYLHWLKMNGNIIDWEYEPETFWFEGIKRGTASYLPDWKVEFPSGKVEYFEVKGYETSKDRTKYKRMKKYHPNIVLHVVDGKWFKENGSKLKSIIKEW
jgi:hypothetical protein